MKIEPKEKEVRGEYMKRQLYMMSSIGLFYIILIALFGIPLLGTFVVVMIKGALDFRYLILGSGVIGCGLVIFYAGKFGLRFLRRMRADGAHAFRDAAGRAGRDQQVQLELFNGLVSFSCGGQRPRNSLPAPGGHAALLTDMRGDPSPSNPLRDPVGQIQSLVELKKEGAIDEAEFRALKKKLIQHICDEPDKIPDRMPDDTDDSDHIDDIIDELYDSAGSQTGGRSCRPRIWPSFRN